MPGCVAAEMGPIFTQNRMPLLVQILQQVATDPTLLQHRNRLGVLTPCHTHASEPVTSEQLPLLPPLGGL